MMVEQRNILKAKLAATVLAGIWGHYGGDEVENLPEFSSRISAAVEDAEDILEFCDL